MNGMSMGLLSPAVLAALAQQQGQVQPTQGLLAPPQKQGFMSRIGDSLAGAENTGADRRGLLGQALLGMAAGMAQTGGQGTAAAIGNGLQTGLLALNQGRENLTNERYKQALMANQGGDPAGFRETHLSAIAAGYEPGTQGYKDFFRRKNREIAGQSSAAITYQKVTGPDGREYMLALDPRAVGAQTIGGGPSFGSFADPSPAQQPVRFRNAAGEEIDVSGVEDPYLREQIIQNPDAFGLLPDGGSAELPPRDTYTPAPVFPRTSSTAGQNPFAGRRPEDQAAATREAEIRVELATAQERARAEAEAAAAKESATQGVKPTKAQEAVDSEYGKEYVTFMQGGAADAEKALSELSGALDALNSERGLTGPWISTMPMAVRTRTNPRSVAVQETVESTVQRSLRAILGAQFTAQEGERIIARAYNPAMSEAENAQRVRRLLRQLQEGFRNKAAMARYYEGNGTLRGFKGKVPSLSDFGIDDQDRRSTPAPRPTRPASDDIDSLLELYR